MADRRPFHKTIIDAIAHVTRVEIQWFADFIKGTKIPANHDAIADAWRERLLCLNVDNDYGVLANLLEQKREAAAEAQRRKEIKEILMREDALER